MSIRCIRLLGVSALLVSGCMSSGPSGTGTVQLRLATTPVAAAGASALAANVSVTLGEDVLDITSVQIVARKIRLGLGSSTCEGGESQGFCALMDAGPELLVPPLVEGTSEATIYPQLPAGTYDRMKLQIHMPEGVSDREFLWSNPTLFGVSIQVTGTYNGAPFTFTTPLTIEQDVPFAEPLVLEEESIMAVTMLIDVQSWFVGPNGLIDPATTDQMLISIIEQNIRNSFRAFEDADGDAVEG